MACLLLLETATDVCSAAISCNGKVIATEEKVTDVNCAAYLTLLIEACLRQANLSLRQLDAVAVSGGPGSYTSLRTGVSTAKGICYALDKPLLAVPTLQALAFAAQQHIPAAHRPICYVPMLDARRQEVWLSIYSETLEPLCSAQPLIIDEDLLQHFRALAPNLPSDTVWVCAGNGMLKIPSHLWESSLIKSSISACSARYLASLANQRYAAKAWENLAYYEPFYMKPPNITQPKKSLQTGDQ
ncbi:MAG: tRNA (adenosine(37)-N6)-threonylcarbamoyltransferase complex dimerization subunit type 1 TsaB [Saprospiraceae bacterium]|nr:tRNA (adenosine(37)-N6)-threonylcarbamoyltransferase complex dimerization subunit type 1 TsaB [Saprospiraceae bacterium]MDW8483494.1 tRNA (adenosine(37)-N6)-threonylcarbamoyltransferase complex dimerization subunit type 1 TsaB [Saprospiraceae bacterium]